MHLEASKCSFLFVILLLVFALYSDTVQAQTQDNDRNRDGGGRGRQDRQDSQFRNRRQRRPANKNEIDESPSTNGKKNPDEGKNVGANKNPNDANFCKGKTLTAGKQNVDGSCSVTVQGQIPAKAQMVSSLIIQPSNDANIPAGQDFDVVLSINNMETGFFDDPQIQYYLTPQTLNGAGIIQGHSHITIQSLTSTTNAPDASTFAFFKGLNDPAADGTLSVTVVGGLSNQGLHRICSMAGARGHQPVLMPVAQRGAQDDCIRINVV